jgi:hypothetical protein
MPAAWQTSPTPQASQNRTQGAQVRSFRDMLLDPLRWAMSSNLHKISSALVLAAISVAFFF